MTKKKQVVEPDGKTQLDLEKIGRAAGEAAVREFFAQMNPLRSTPRELLLEITKEHGSAVGRAIVDGLYERAYEEAPPNPIRKFAADHGFAVGTAISKLDRRSKK